MSVEPGKTLTFTIKAEPVRPAERKTIRRLMRMQPKIQTGLRKLARRRRQSGNVETARAGRTWLSRVRTTKLTRVEQGQTFTLHVTPQIIPDIRSVEQYLEIKKAK